MPREPSCCTAAAPLRARGYVSRTMRRTRARQRRLRSAPPGPIAALPALVVVVVVLVALAALPRRALGALGRGGGGSGSACMSLLRSSLCDYCMCALKLDDDDGRERSDEKYRRDECGLDDSPFNDVVIEEGTGKKKKEEEKTDDGGEDDGDGQCLPALTRDVADDFAVLCAEGNLEVRESCSLARTYVRLLAKADRRGGRSCGRPCPPLSCPCVNRDNLAQCKRLRDEVGCTDIVHLESCPLQFECRDPPVNALAVSSATAKKRDVCGPPPENNDCPTGVRDWRKCKELAEGGCEKIVSNEGATCPEYWCVDHENGSQQLRSYRQWRGTGHGSRQPLHAQRQRQNMGRNLNYAPPGDTEKCEDGDERGEEHIRRLDEGDDGCGSPDDACMDSKNWNECMDLVEDGCRNIAVLESCPLQFRCKDDDLSTGETG